MPERLDESPCYPDFMNVSVDEAQERQTLPTGTEVMLEVQSRIQFDSEKSYLLLDCKVVQCSSAGFDVALTKHVSHFLRYPQQDDDGEARNDKLLALARFYAACSLPSAVSDPHKFVGCRFWVILKETEDPTYGKQNAVKRLLKPRSA